MEERRGESSDVWMQKTGHRHCTKDEERLAVGQACDAEGIDPSLSLPERVARLQDIHQGSPLMVEERTRKESYAIKV